MAVMVRYIAYNLNFGRWQYAKDEKGNEITNDIHKAFMFKRKPKRLIEKGWKTILVRSFK